MKAELSRADILVDATQRTDSSRPLIPNEWVAWLPEHAVIADLCVDPYLPEDSPPVVRAIEGIPRGNLDHYVFAPEDPDWSATVPSSIPTLNRRHVVSCYSWPGIHPRECMEHYGRQLLPVVETLVRLGYNGLSPAGDAAARAVYRGSLRAYLAGSTPRERISRTVLEGTGGEE
jgi:alanine dehydrogenase